MKKLVSSLFIGGFVLLLFVFQSCNKENIEQNENENTQYSYFLYKHINGSYSFGKSIIIDDSNTDKTYEVKEIMTNDNLKYYLIIEKESDDIVAFIKIDKGNDKIIMLDILNNEQFETPLKEQKKLLKYKLDYIKVAEESNTNNKVFWGWDCGQWDPDWDVMYCCKVRFWIRFACGWYPV